jgi:hypothetical protein
VTISTISSEIGRKNLGGNKSQSVDNHNYPRQNSFGRATTTADGSQVRAILLHAAANSPSQNNPSQPLVTPVINGLGLGLKFSTDKATGTPIITVIDLKSGEVVRQIPSEEVVNFLRQFENGKGALISLKL